MANGPTRRPFVLLLRAVAPTATFAKLGAPLASAPTTRSEDVAFIATAGPSEFTR